MSSRPAFTTISLALTLALLTPSRAQVNLPALGDSVSEQVSVGAERRLGEQVMREIRRDPDYLDDPVLLEYVQSIWRPLVAAARARGDIGVELDARFDWEAFLVRDRSVNAFALPGGFIGVHLGLIAITGSRDELAAVLAHELSHLTQRHIARSIVNQQRQSLVGLAALIVGIIAASRSSSADATNAVVTGGQAAMVQGMLNFSRDMEREADRVGFAVLEGAGFAPSGMAQMFEKLEGASRLNDSLNYPYLRTHPLTIERIGEARLRLGPGVQATPAAGSLMHELMRARARVLMDPRVETRRRLQAADPGQAGSASERIAAAATTAMASLRLRDLDRARAGADRAIQLLRELPPDPAAERQLALLQAEVLLEVGQPSRAAAALESLAADSSRPLQLLRGQIALAAGAAEPMRRSAEDLQTRVAQNPGDATAWLIVSQLWQRLGQPLRALRAEAESRAAIGDISGAIDRLRAGQRMARGSSRADFVESSVIDTRVRELEAQRRELAAALRG